MFTKKYSQIFCVLLVYLVSVQSYKSLRCNRNYGGDWCALEEYGSEKDLQMVEIDSTNPNVTQLFLNKINSNYLAIALKKFPNILGLAIENCGLVNLTENKFAEAKNLIDLDINGNKISTIYDDSFAGALHIEVMKLVDNRIQVIAQFAFRGLVDLKELIITDNQIKVLELTVFNGLASMTHLNISNNLIVELQKNLFEDNRNMQIVDASNNIISSIYPFLFNHLTIKSLNLTSNFCINKQWNGTLNFGEFYEDVERCFSPVIDADFKDESIVLMHFYDARKESVSWRNKFIVFFVMLAVGNIVPALVCGVIKCRKKRMFCFRGGLSRLNSSDALVYNEYTN